MYVDSNPGGYDAALEKLKGAGSVFMLVMVRFRDEAFYADGTDLPPATGREVYFQRYLPTVAQIASEILPNGQVGEILFTGEGQAQPTGPEDEQWDLIALIKWATMEDAHLLNTHPEYAKRALQHRRAGALNMRTVIATELPVVMEG
jgi:hypothetical protein